MSRAKPKKTKSKSKARKIQPKLIKLTIGELRELHNAACGNDFENEEAGVAAVDKVKELLDSVDKHYPEELS